MAGDGFVHLHVHTEYSMLDGAAQLKPLFAETSRLGMSAVAMTDHGNMFGAFGFYQEAKAAGVKPIIGIEAYLAPEDRFHKKPVFWGGPGERADDISAGGRAPPCAISARGICAGGNTWSATPVSTAARGIPSNCAVCGSWTMTRPPAACTSWMPREPSVPPPDRTTAAARRPQSCASERKNTSTGRVSSVSVQGNSVRCQVTGSVEPLLGVLAASGVHQLLSREPSLEELFLARYGREPSATRESAHA